ncbi:MAG TPA: hypothetical protein HA254_04085 [Candidatus Diapherotrites archaeon]|uniref:Uncharacterized protein n=1 Tax=Candidatus Iainarchaeum sp. TaxID=3101447 RepID=A0A7J4IY95_9ARCH|nr:hypothetical protein [Candidatus Diapherotrites archaeon]
MLSSGFFQWQVNLCEISLILITSPVRMLWISILAISRSAAFSSPCLARSIMDVIIALFVLSIVCNISGPWCFFTNGSTVTRPPTAVSILSALRFLNATSSSNV